jgi:SAM-dependent methyltransferase
MDLKFPLRPALPLPAGFDESRLHAYLESVCVADAPPADMLNYCRSDFRRFVYTWSLIADRTGRALELGANPYFTTMLLKDFTKLELTLSNFFAEGLSNGAQAVNYRDAATGTAASTTFAFDHFNIEKERYPYDDGSFDVVLFCEIIEHLLMDPVQALSEISRILKPGGELVLTTPNVSRLENVAKMIAGENIYDPYSGFGPYGRHNREYNRHELFHLLAYCGFTPEVMFTADVHANHATVYASAEKLEGLVRFREHDLGQYIFIRARKTGAPRGKRPSELYRSYAPDQLEPWA